MMHTSRRLLWALSVLLVLPAALRAGLFPQPVRPVLEYVVDNPDGTFTAWFGYDNLNPTQVSIPFGHDNRFTPPPQDRGQPTTFLPGRREAVFSLNFTNGNPTWRLDGESVSAGRNQKPTVTLTSPLNGASLVAPATVQLAATAADADGTVARVEFFQNGAKIAQLTAPPYQFSVTGLAAGSYDFRAKAVDNRNAPGFSATATVTVVGGNQPPSVSLTAPADGATFTVGSVITFSANADDADGTVAKVEFYDDLTKLGEDTTAPYSFDWSGAAAGGHTISARATDNAGATAISAVRTITVQSAGAALPFVANFETSEGYSAGALAGQIGWSVTGTANVVTAPVFDGFQAVAIAGTQPPSVASHDFTAAAPQVTFADYFARPVAGTTPDLSVIFQTTAGKIALAGVTPAQVYAFAGNGAGGGTWQATPATRAVDANGLSVDWLRLSVREDYVAKKWDLYLDSRLIAYDLPFIDNSATALTRFSIAGHASTDGYFDDFVAAFENPVFVDADKDGMDDAWETAHGLNPALNDRDADPDADGLPNIREYLLGTNPVVNNNDSDSDGLADNWETQHFGSLDYAGADDSDGDGQTNAQEFAAGTNPADFGNGRSFVAGQVPLTGPVAYAYDASGRLASATYPGGSAQNFTFDAASNLTAVTGGGGGGTIVQWRATYNLPLDGTGDGADSAILAADGLPNLAKYAFGFDPRVAVTSAQPSVVRALSGGTGYLTLTYRRPHPAPADLVYRVEVSADGNTWTSGAGATAEISTSVIGGLATIAVRDATPTGSPVFNRRIRLSIERRAAP
jgi:YD repeat-containing protein